MMIAHAVGWPVVEGGSARLIDALVAELTSLGGQVETAAGSVPWMTCPRQGRAARRHPRQLAAIAGGSIPGWQGSALARFRYGPGVCKVDWALSGPVPWEAASCREAGTVHWAAR
jgi:phytoene dehydrogenase-like protein